MRLIAIKRITFSQLIIGIWVTISVLKNHKIISKAQLTLAHTYLRSSSRRSKVGHSPNIAYEVRGLMPEFQLADSEYALWPCNRHNELRMCIKMA